VLAFVFEIDGLALLEQLKRSGPEIQVENFTFARQHIVLHVEAEHGGEVRFHNGIGHQVSQFGQFARAGFDRVQRGLAPLHAFGVILVIGGSEGVEVPAIVVEAHRRVGQHGADIGGRLVPQVVETHHIGHLHAGIVDVVLHFHTMAARAQHADESIAQRGVAQMADVRRLVGIDIGVLDDDLFAGAGRRIQPAGEQCSRVRRAVQANINVAIARHFHGGHAGDGADFLHQLRRNFARRLAQLFGELESRGHGHIAEVALARLLDGDG
jgi:hypothetical protein